MRARGERGRRCTKREGKQRRIQTACFGSQYNITRQKAGWPGLDLYRPQARPPPRTQTGKKKKKKTEKKRQELARSKVRAARRSRLVCRRRMCVRSSYILYRYWCAPAVAPQRAGRTNSHIVLHEKKQNHKSYRSPHKKKKTTVY